MLDDETHMQRCLYQLRSKDKPIEKYIYLSQLKNADEHMFYRIALSHM
jgi:malate dehydrogenase (oxaloacetate-decarboxylating)(NADP+)